MHIRQNDIVQVIAGEDRGVRGKVLKVTPKSGKVVVEGVNRVYKHMQRSQKNPQGGRLSKEMPVDISNIMLVDPQTNKPTRVGVRLTKDGKRERYAKATGGSLGIIAAQRRDKAKQ
ncbi:MAG TPA: 50S ribosomal protein L24 [Pirellulales bacterium]|jgi:large subunit ribosomal protein L24